MVLYDYGICLYIYREKVRLSVPFHYLILIQSRRTQLVSSTIVCSLFDMEVDVDRLSLRRTPVPAKKWRDLRSTPGFGDRTWSTWTCKEDDFPLQPGAFQVP